MTRRTAYRRHAMGPGCEAVIACKSCGKDHKERWRVRDQAGQKKYQPKEENFWRMVKIGAGCWEWQGARNIKGYGKFGQGCMAPRLAWQFTQGPIPPGLFVCHRCDNPPCCRPDHLFLGTAADNNADRAAKGRSLMGERIHTAKLRSEDIPGIRYGYVLSGCTQAELARALGISKSTIGPLLRRENWGHV